MNARCSLLLMLLLIAAAAVTTGVVCQTALPHPRDATREQLVDWLVLRDLRGEPDELRLVLVRRLEGEFGDGVDWDSVSEQLNQSQRQRFRDNLIVLLRPWFMDKLDGYLLLSGDERVAYVDRLLDTVTAWRSVDTLHAGVQEGTDGKQNLFDILRQQAIGWQKEAESSRARQIGEFLLAIQLRYVVSGRADSFSSPQ